MTKEKKLLNEIINAIQNNDYGDRTQEYLEQQIAIIISCFVVPTLRTAEYKSENYDSLTNRLEYLAKKEFVLDMFKEAKKCGFNLDIKI